MAGLFLLVLFGLYAWAVTALLRRTSLLWTKVAIVVAAVLLPTADGYYGRIQLDRMCAKDGGLKIHRTVKDVLGFYSSIVDGSELDKYGFQFVETSDSGYRLFRYTRNQSGQVSRENVSQLRSLFEYRVVQGDTRDIYLKDSFQVIVRESGEVLGEVVNFAYAGGWIERFAAGLVAGRGNAGRCNAGYPERIREQLIKTILRPGGHGHSAHAAPGQR